MALPSEPGWIHNLAAVSQNFAFVSLVRVLLSLPSWRDYHKSEEGRRKKSSSKGMKTAKS